jgi:hypothetical protein
MKTAKQTFLEQQRDQAVFSFPNPYRRTRVRVYHAGVQNHLFGLIGCYLAVVRRPLLFAILSAWALWLACR